MRENEINHNVIFCFFLTLWLVRTCVVYVVHEFLGEKRIKILNKKIEKERGGIENFLLLQIHFYEQYIFLVFTSHCVGLWRICKFVFCERFCYYTHTDETSQPCAAVFYCFCMLQWKVAMNIIILTPTTITTTTIIKIK